MRKIWSAYYRRGISAWSGYIGCEWSLSKVEEPKWRLTMIKYMKTFGLDVNGEAFEHYSWYFRNALVRANYNDWKNGVHATTKFLEQFFCNLLMGTDYELKNRYMHLDYVEESQSANREVLKCNNCTLECSLEELAILKVISNNPQITQKGLAEKIGKSQRAISTRLKEMQGKNYIQRVNGNDMVCGRYLWISIFHKRKTE